MRANLGAPGQRWLVAQGEYSGAEALLYIDVMSGGLFDLPVAVLALLHARIPR